MSINHSSCSVPVTKTTPQNASCTRVQIFSFLCKINTRSPPPLDHLVQSEIVIAKFSKVVIARLWF